MKTLTLSGLMRATNRNLFVLVVLLVTATLLLSGVLRQYLSDLIQGARLANNAALSRITSVSEFTPDYLTVTGTKNFDTGYESVKREDNGKTTNTGWFRLLRVNDRYLIVKTAPKDDKRLKFTGVLEGIPTQVESGVVEDLRRSGLESKLYPFLLHADNPPQPWLALIFAALTLVTIWYAAQWARRVTNAEQHPLVSRLKPYGQFNKTQASINADLAQPNPVRIGSTRLMQNWLLRVNRFHLDAVPLSDVTWVYGKVTQHSTNGIPTGKSFETVICSQHQPALEIKLKKKQSDAFLIAVLERAPWAVSGFNDELKQLWERDRNGFRTHVEERKAQFANGTLLAKATPDA